MLLHTSFFYSKIPPPPRSTLFPYTTLFRSHVHAMLAQRRHQRRGVAPFTLERRDRRQRSEEHTSELQSHHELVCRLLLEKKNGSSHSANYAFCNRFPNLLYLED